MRHAVQIDINQWLDESKMVQERQKKARACFWLFEKNMTDRLMALVDRINIWQGKVMVRITYGSLLVVDDARLRPLEEEQERQLKQILGYGAFDKQASMAAIQYDLGLFPVTLQKRFAQVAIIQDYNTEAKKTTPLYAALHPTDHKGGNPGSYPPGMEGIR